jgi:hypothetical protein
LGFERFGDSIYDWSSWPVITAAEVSEIRVLEYSPDRCRVLALVGRDFTDITPEGEVVRVSRPDATCAIYAFVREGDTWKAQGVFPMLAPYDDLVRDWHDSPDWLKAAVGELPDSSEVLKICLHYGDPEN